MFHYPSHHNGRCNLLGLDPVDLDEIRFVRFQRCRRVRAQVSAVLMFGEVVEEASQWRRWGSGRR